MATGMSFWLFVHWGLGNGRESWEDYTPWQIGLLAVSIVGLTIMGVLLSGTSAAVLGIVPAVTLGFRHEFTAPRPEGYTDGLWVVGVGMITIGTLIGVLFIASLTTLVIKYRRLGSSVGQ